MTANAEIGGLFDQWNAALQTCDPDQVVALYADDAILLPTLSNDVRHNHAEIRDYFVHFLQKKPFGTIDQSNIRDLGDVAVHSGVYTFALTADGETSHAQCRFTYVYARSGDGWKIIEHHSSLMPE
ncbi:MAG: SgcJ/EcaC family oxidoreductase [Erythrobacter sp.]|nr:SgcJ/EcaC family oxidoreductase [Erythrobacter sp.]